MNHASIRRSRFAQALPKLALPTLALTTLICAAAMAPAAAQTSGSKVTTTSTSTTTATHHKHSHKTTTDTASTTHEADGRVVKTTTKTTKTTTTHAARKSDSHKVHPGHDTPVAPARHHPDHTTKPVHVVARPAPVAPPVPVAAPPPPAPLPPDPTIGTSTKLKLPYFAAMRANAVRMRAGPGTRYPIDWLYQRRDLPVEVEREFEVWRLVSEPDGTKGWVHQATLTGRRTFLVTGNDPQTVHAEANDTAAAVAILKPGVVGRVSNCAAGSDWCAVEVKGYKGYMNRAQFWGTLPGEAVGQ